MIPTHPILVRLPGSASPSQRPVRGRRLGRSLGALVLVLLACDKPDSKSGGDELQGACCDSNLACEIRGVGACEADGRLFTGADTCEPNPCSLGVRGACCLRDSENPCEIREQSACFTDGGDFAGAGTECTPERCPQATVGACCGVLSECSLVTVYECTQVRGFYQGAGAACEPDPCPSLVIGACCQPNGTCTVDDERRCDASFQGAGSSCNPNPCAQPVAGACCRDGNECISATNVTCDGRFLGAASTCRPLGICEMTAPGACCDAAGMCSMTAPDGCEGSFGGPGTSCDTDPCAPQPADMATPPSVDLAVSPMDMARPAPPVDLGVADPPDAAR